MSHASPGRPAGSRAALPSSSRRRLTPAMLPAEGLAEAFTGLDMKPGEILAAFKAAAPHLGYRAGLVHAIDWLFRFTKPQDWQPGRRWSVEFR